MAGIAEAALAFELMVIYGTAIFIGFLAVVAIIRRMAVVAGVSICLVILSSLFLSPWMANDFRRNDDPDWDGFVGQFQSAGAWWIVASVLAILSLGITLFLQHGKRPAVASDDIPLPTSNDTMAITAHPERTVADRSIRNS